MTAAVVVFPGQGIQRRGMGARWFDRFPDLVARADEQVGYSLRRLCLDDPHNRLAWGLFAQPAAYVVNALAYRALRADVLEPNRIEPAAVLGHSLGEYNALEAAGVFDFATGLRLVLARADATCDLPGRMLAVVGLDRDEIAAALARQGLPDVTLANLNSAAQTVLSGPAPQIAQAQTVLRAAGARLVTRLRINGAYHSPLMAPAARPFAAELRRIRPRHPRVPVICNVTARPHRIETLGRRLTEHLTHPVLWQPSIEWLLDTLPGRVDFYEAGEDGVLTRLIQHIENDMRRRDNDTARVGATKEDT
ncbi:Polyketide biosynthesis malonyl CoA-acyl carrier protein transacylase BaeC [Actinomadura rubteroloni]|uniref:Malonyl CoA-acyl carrier protein transacylase n=1 Tax=Actinomadura rubteroloni TaxID=1926885 RepID=A0A2P4UEW8_9ACTN|nr:acyltransferase domain-containing protein [Actinomadura rubteroloni]POM23581.1 Polyketide biosynthesis malonyl CoA-acyl carrier protein transacylase BaeC [Actinomadura rubteroloni]